MLYLKENRQKLYFRKKFLLREFRVTCDGRYELPSSPYYEEGGGIVIDWIPPDEDD